MRSYMTGRFRLVSLLLVAAFGVPVLFAAPASADQTYSISEAYHDAFASWEFPQPEGSLKRVVVDAMPAARSCVNSLLLASYNELVSSGAIVLHIKVYHVSVTTTQL